MQLFDQWSAAAVSHMRRRFFYEIAFPVSPAARLQATFELLQDVYNDVRPADAVISAFFRSRRFIVDKDRGRILELLSTLLRHHARLGWWLAKHKAQDIPRNRFLAWLVLDGQAPKQINGLFSQYGVLVVDAGTARDRWVLCCRDAAK
jgi:hypothetical protein